MSTTPLDSKSNQTNQPKFPENNQNGPTATQNNTQPPLAPQNDNPDRDVNTRAAKETGDKNLKSAMEISWTFVALGAITLCMTIVFNPFSLSLLLFPLFAPIILVPSIVTLSALIAAIITTVKYNQSKA